MRQTGKDEVADAQAMPGQLLGQLRRRFRRHGAGHFLAARQHGGLLRVGGPLVIGAPAFLNQHPPAAEGGALKPLQRLLRVLQHQALLPPQRRIGGDIARERLRLIQQGVKHEQPAIRMPPQRLPLRIGARQLLHARPDLALDEAQKRRRAAIDALLCHRIGQGLALRTRRGVVPGAGGGVKTPLGRIADQHQQRQLLQRRPQAGGGQKFKQRIAIQRIKRGKAAFRRRGLRNGHKHAVRAAVFVIQIKTVKSVALMLAGEHAGVGQAADFVIDRRLGRRGKNGRGRQQKKSGQEFQHFPVPAGK